MLSDSVLAFQHSEEQHHHSALFHLQCPALAGVSVLPHRAQTNPDADCWERADVELSFVSVIVSSNPKVIPCKKEFNFHNTAPNNSFNRSRASLPFMRVARYLAACCFWRGTVNSGVRFLLNYKDQSLESVCLNLESHRSSCVLMNLECSEPAPAPRVDALVR